LAGGLALQLLGVTRLLNRLEHVVFAIAVGLNLLSLYALAVGLAGGLRLRWLFIGPLAGLFAYGVVRAVQSRRANANREPETPASPDERRWLWWLLAEAPFAAVMVLGAILPPYEYDVREYHLQVPKEWFLQGRITFLPHNIYGNMPLGSELTALWGMALMGGDDAWWWGAIVGKTLMACYSLVTIAGLVAFGRRVHSTAAGVLAAVAYASTPWITQVSIIGHNEGPAGLYFLCAIYACWLAWKNQQPADANRLIALSGFLAGAAVACKYPLMLFLVVPLRLGDAAEVRQRRIGAGHLPLRLRPASPPAGWLAKNAALTGNPTYPLLLASSTATNTRRRMNSGRAHSRSRTPRVAVHLPGCNPTAWNLWRAKPASLVRSHWPPAGHSSAACGILFVAAVCAGGWWLLTPRWIGSSCPAPIVAAAGINAAALPRRGHARPRVIAAILQFPVRVCFSATIVISRWMLSPRRPEIAAISGQRIDIPHHWLNAHVPPGKGAARRRCRAVRPADASDLQHLFRRLPIHAVICRTNARGATRRTAGGGHLAHLLLVGPPGPLSQPGQLRLHERLCDARHGPPRTRGGAGPAASPPVRCTPSARHRQSAW
jgi:hypothetical protein